MGWAWPMEATTNGFNPHAHEGRDFPAGECLPAVVCVSIRTPMKGAILDGMVKMPYMMWFQSARP